MIVTKPKRNMHADSHTCGLSFFNRMFEGISNRMYGMKKMVRAVLYSVFFSFRSFCKPKIEALAMLVRSRNANKYKMLRTGMTRKSILTTSFHWVV